MRSIVVMLMVVGLAAFGAVIEQQVVRRDVLTSGPVAGYSHTATQHISQIPLSRFARTAEETDLGYLKRILDSVHLSTYHCERDGFHLSLLERLAVRLSGGISLFSNEGILMRERFICGYCHQRAFIEAKILSDNGMPTDVLSVNGHVVARTAIDGVEYITDPDYGVGPFEYSVDPEKLLVVARHAYRMVTWVDAAPFADMIASRNDNISYGENIFAIERRQSAAFAKADVFARIGLAFAALCVVLSGFVLFWHRRGRVSDKRPAPVSVSAD